MVVCASSPALPAGVADRPAVYAARPLSPPCSPPVVGGSSLLRNGNRFLAPVRIDGYSAVLMLIDSGAQGSGLSPAIAASLHLKEDLAHVAHNFGIDGVAGVRLRDANALTIGALHWPGPIRITPVNVGFAQQDSDAAAPLGLVGANVLSAYDVELDFQAQTITFHDGSCGDHLRPAWGGQTDAFAPWETPQKLFVIPVVLNGHQLRAIVDTGAQTTTISRASAMTAGVDAEALAQDKGVAVIGVVGTPVSARRHRFESMSVGSTLYKSPILTVEDRDLVNGADMLLGMDVLQRRKLWLSYSTGRLFMQGPPVAVVIAKAAADPPPAACSWWTAQGASPC